MTWEQVGTADPGSASESLPALEDYLAGHSIASQIKEILSFEYTIQYADTGVIADEKVLSAVRAQGMAALAELLERSGVNYIQDVEVSQTAADNITHGQALLSFVQQHSRLGWAINIGQDRIVITRQASSFSDFYDWYVAIMPRLAFFEETVRRVVEGVSETSLRVVQTRYEFRILLSDFESRGNPRRNARNVEVLQAYIPSLPHRGQLRELSEQTFFRLDMTVSKLEEYERGGTTCKRNAWYSLQAPFNEYSRYLEFRADLRNASVEDLNDTANFGKTILPFDSNWQEDYKLALVDFLRDGALEGFLGKLLEHWDFQTVRSV